MFADLPDLDLHLTGTHVMATNAWRCSNFASQTHPVMAQDDRGVW